LPKDIHVRPGPVVEALAWPERGHSYSAEFIIAEQDSLETCMIGMDENLPKHLGDVSIDDVFKKMTFEDLPDQIRSQYRTCMKGII